MPPEIQIDGAPPLTPAQVGRLFGVTGTTVSRWAVAGRLPSFRTAGGHRRFPAEDVARLYAGGAK